jgi:hypothetical protein
VAGVVLGAGGAQATGSRSGSPVRASTSHGGHADKVARQARWEAAKTQTLDRLIAQGKEHVEMLDEQDPTQSVRTPRQWHYQPATAAEVQARFREFQTRLSQVRENSHLMVIAYRPAEYGRLPQARLIVPSVGDGGVLEYIDADEDLSAAEATYTLEGLEGLGRKGYRFYTQVGTYLRPLQTQTPPWWPEGNNGRTRRRFDAQLAKDTVNTQILQYLYQSDMHSEKLTAKDVTGHISVFKNNKYNANDPAHVMAIATRLRELARIGLIKNHGQIAGAKGKIYQYSALTPADIQRHDAMSIQERINLFAPAESTGWERKIVEHMYHRDNRGQPFDAARLKEEMPELTKLNKDYVVKKLWLLHEADLVELVEKGVQGHKHGKYRAFS